MYLIFLCEILSTFQIWITNFGNNIPKIDWTYQNKQVKSKSQRCKIFGLFGTKTFKLFYWDERQKHEQKSEDRDRWQVGIHHKSIKHRKGRIQERSRFEKKAQMSLFF